MNYDTKSFIKMALLPYLFLSLSLSALGQQSDSPKDSLHQEVHGEKASLFKINFLDNPEIGFGRNLFALNNGISLGYELKLAPGFSAEAGLGIRPEFSTARGDSGRTSTFDAALFAHLGARYYYNLEKRNELGKSTDGFSANYLGINVSKTGFPGGHPNDVSIEAAWGIQRSIGNKLYFDLGLGLQYLPNAERIKVAPVVSFKLGFAF